MRLVSVSSAVPVVIMTCRAADSTNLRYHSETVERSSLDEHVPFSKASLQGATRERTAYIHVAGT